MQCDEPGTLLPQRASSVVKTDGICVGYCGPRGLGRKHHVVKRSLDTASVDDQPKDNFLLSSIFYLLYVVYTRVYFS